MRKIESLSIRYVGYKEPETDDEIQLEILGLETAMAAAKQRICVLRQSLHLKKMSEAGAQEQNEKTIEEATSTEKTE